MPREVFEGLEEVCQRPLESRLLTCQFFLISTPGALSTVLCSLSQ